MTEINILEIRKQATIIAKEAENIIQLSNTIKEELKSANILVSHADSHLSKNVEEYIELYNKIVSSSCERYNYLSKVMLDWADSSEETEMKALSNISNLTAESDKIKAMLATLEEK